jgi:hypothetical protein
MGRQITRLDEGDEYGRAREALRMAEVGLTHQREKVADCGAIFPLAPWCRTTSSRRGRAPSTPEIRPYGRSD